MKHWLLLAAENDRLERRLLLHVECDVLLTENLFFILRDVSMMHYWAITG
jgi:hypothetical protein